MLPAIVFIFSRKGCDKKLFDTVMLNLTTNEERKAIRGIINDYVERYPYLATSRYLKYLENGFASHHAGLLPAVKNLVEDLFKTGLIKVVFATETLAAGINMPARTTVISALSKRTNDGHRMLSPSEFLQMSGRAGRRGMDEVGYVVTVASPWEGAVEAAGLASSPPDPLVSQFTPTYGMVLNLLQRYTLAEAEFLISKSFSAYLSENAASNPAKAALLDYEQKLDNIDTFTCPADLSDDAFIDYLQSKAILRQLNKDLKTYHKVMRQHGKDPDIQAAVSDLEGKKTALNGVIHASPCYDCELYKKHRLLIEREEKYTKKIKQLTRAVERERNTVWRSFMSHYDLLRTIEYLDADNRPTYAGRLTAEVRAENEVYVAELILEGCLDNLTPPELAGLVCAITNDSNKLHQYSDLPVSSAVRQRFKTVRHIAGRIDKLQRQFGIEKDVRLNPIASGLLQAWADGMGWDDLIDATTIDQGDLVRIIRRTADLLRQLSRNPLVKQELSTCAGQALDQLYRDPITDDNEALKQLLGENADKLLDHEAPPPVSAKDDTPSAEDPS
ncbi:MAG: hypothetical protein KC476_02730 [Cyanobacteria bacterium HKST-UBA06]|nr:hypothetical protein [Cyanobacteria bacterium HKST-UBA06]